MSTTPVPPLDEGASPKIREKLRKDIFPKIVLEGRDPKVKDVYLPIVHQMENEFKVDYNTAKKAYDKVLKEWGLKENPDDQKSQTKVGGVTVEVTPRAKDTTRRAERAQSEAEALYTCKSCGAQFPLIENQKNCAKCGAKIGEVKPSRPVAREALAKLFASTHKTSGDMLFGIADKAWSVKVERPDVVIDKDGKERFLALDDPQNPYYQAGDIWAEVCEVYEIELPKILALLMAGTRTLQIFAMPLMIARGEAMKKAQTDRNASK